MLPALSEYLKTRKDYLEQGNTLPNGQPKTLDQMYGSGSSTQGVTNPFASSNNRNQVSQLNPFSGKYTADHEENERFKDLPSNPASHTKGIANNQSVDGSPTNPFSLKEKEEKEKAKKRSQVPKACTNCRKKKAGCDRARPCKRCVSGGEESSCCDTPRKKRGSSIGSNNIHPSTPSSNHVSEDEGSDEESVGSGGSSNGSGSSSNGSNDSGGSSSGDSLRSANHHNKKLKSSHKSNHSPPHSPLLSGKHNGSHEDHFKPGKANTTMGIATQEIKTMVESMTNEVVSRILVYIVDKYGERNLIKGAYEATKAGGNEAVEMHLIRDYVLSIFDKSSKCGDWNMAVATVVTLVDDGLHLLNSGQPRSAMLFFTGYLEGLHKNDPWRSCFQQNHRHTADVPFLVDSFCSKLLQFDSIFNDYEKEILRNRLEPFVSNITPSHEGFIQFYGENAFANHSRNSPPTEANDVNQRGNSNGNNAVHVFNDCPEEVPNGSPESSCPSGFPSASSSDDGEKIPAK
eukprot:TRINITY_DN1645_c0_g1_i2.p1 TRINITY_DN1645_c0_g1~~TRINITY_DN1645_c0_g1_i2.p1  ORF type:complete len:515 (-),score=131.32 TRINITY_DN1645_c0_g1_i2:214-1758(-)